jgi:KAP family P-loop domain
MEPPMEAAERKKPEREWSTASEEPAAKIRRQSTSRSSPDYETETEQPGRGRGGFQFDDDQRSEATARFDSAAASDLHQGTPEPAPPNVRPQAISDEAVGDVARDELRFGPSVRAFVRFLRAKETMPPLAIAVRAPWGRGKTSFMRMVETELNLISNERLLFRRHAGELQFATTWFNPWKYNTRGELWTAYLAAVTGCIRDRLGFWRRKRLGLKRYFADLKNKGNRAEFCLRLFVFLALLGLFLWVVLDPGMAAIAEALVDSIFTMPVAAAIKGSVLGKLLTWLGGALLLHQAYVQIVQKFDLGLLEYLRRSGPRQGVASLTEFETELRMLAEAKPDNLKVIIFIDDLDRCAPDILWETMVAQQLLEVSSKCIFILGMDLEVVARTLDATLAKHSQLPPETIEPFGHGRGYQFLEKIIQTQINIPAYGKDQIRQFIEDLVPSGAQGAAQPQPPSTAAQTAGFEEEVAEDSPELRAAMLEHGPVYFTNPRRIKRFINGLRLYVYLANASSFPVEVDQLARFLVLTERWPRIVDDLLRHPDWLDAASTGILPSDARESTHWSSEWGRVQPFLSSMTGLALFDGIDGVRLRELCDWYGFTLYSDGMPEIPTEPALAETAPSQGQFSDGRATRAL